jgi:sarcosine oxidase
MSREHEFVVVGAGLLGLAAARALAGRGRDVLVLEQAEIGHPGAGSQGSCRIFRLGYDDPGYVAMASRARGLWRELEDASGERILLPTPQLSFGAGLAAVRDGMRRAGARYELLTADEAAARFPGVATGGPALLEPESCVIAADRALHALAAAVPPARTGFRVTSLRDDGRRVTLQAADGSVLVARHAIICAGPWTASLLATAGITVPSAATLEQVAYLGPTHDPMPDMPIIVGYGDEMPYGLPVPGSPLYKVGIHHSGPVTDPDRRVSEPDAGLSRRLADAVRECLPALDPRPVRTERCVYDNTPDEGFILDRAGRITIGSGTSGHGFKFGPLLGGWLASLAAGESADLPPARFGIGRFSA